MIRRFTLLLTTAVLVVVSLASCGGFFPAADQIISLSLSPTSAYILPTSTQQFSATATFGNNTTGDVTSQVTWLSSATNVATIDSSGLATGVALGSATITAKSNNSSVTSTALLTVSTKIITSITVIPSDPSISLSAGQTQQFTAQATFSDGSFGIVSASWTSSSPSIATISSSGLASPVSIGATAINASAGGVVGTTSLTVTE
jgi:trimeric autotransporter adhesin